MAPSDLEGFQQLEEEPVVQEVVGLGSSMGLEINEEDLEKLVEDHRKKLSFEEPAEIQSVEAETVQQRIAFGDEKIVRAFQLRILRRCSVAGMDRPNLRRIITRILPSWKWA